jgi:hypothetical protein
VVVAKKQKNRKHPKGWMGKNFRGYTGTALLTADTRAAIAVVPPSDPLLEPQPSSTKEHTIRSKVAQAVAYQLEGKTRAEAAELLGLTIGSLNQYFYLAGKFGWLVTADAQEQLAYQTVHKVVRNIDAALDGDDPERRQEMTIEAAKGLGLFKRHEVVTNDGATVMSALTVRIEQPVGSQEIAVGSIGGVGAYQDAEEI